MAVAENIPSASASEEKTVERKGLWYLDLKYVTIGTLVVLGLAIAARWYQTWAGWDYGMDSTSPEFQKYWMTLFYVQTAAAIIIFPTVMGYLWFTRDKNLDKLAPEVELRRTMQFVGTLFVYAFTFVWAGSFFAEQDAAWHQVVVRDTSFTPSHIIEFYGMFPLFIILGFGSFLFAITRLPLYAKGFSLPLVIAVVGPMMVLPNVGFNEWGHAFWFMEEYFTAPLHYGFVFFGWAILGLGGILVQLVSRLTVLMDQVWGKETTS